MATIFWDNVSEKIACLPFIVPEQVTWWQLSEALNQIAFSFGERKLTVENLHFLAEKIFRKHLKSLSPDKLVSRSLFYKDQVVTFHFGNGFMLH